MKSLHGRRYSLGSYNTFQVAELLLQKVNDALEYAGRIKHEQKDFLTEQGIESIY